MAADTTMPFGKYKGELLSDIPRDYLEWVLYQAEPKPWLRDAIFSELQYRSGEQTEAAPRIPSTVSIEMALKLVDHGRRTMAQKHHPDMGGSGETMASINTAADWLSEHLYDLLRIRGR